MYLLYADESGEITDPNDRVLVVAGIAVHEDAVRPLAGAINNTLNQFISISQARTLEIHGSPMRGGRQGWQAVAVKKRHALVYALLELIASYHHPSSGSSAEIFVVAVDRNHSQSPFETAYGEFLFMFDEYLRQGRRQGEPHNGVLIADRGKYERMLEAWVEVARGRYRRPQQDDRRLYALAETPFFVDSKSTRLMQLADLVAHSVFRGYNFDDWSRARTLVPTLTGDGAARLLHLTGDGACECPGCGNAVDGSGSRSDEPAAE
ncbi:MAG: DUF3800 domain-containing protein [Solirubrobacteraceae bacterium]